MNIHEFLNSEFRKAIEQGLCSKLLDFSKHDQAQEFFGKSCINKKTGEEGLIIFMVIDFFDGSQTDLKTFYNKYGFSQEDNFFKFFIENSLEIYPIFLSEDDNGEIEANLKSLNQTPPEGGEYNRKKPILSIV